MFILWYWPEGRKVRIRKDIYMSKKMQQHLNDIANAIHDNVSPWNPGSLAIEYDPGNSSSSGYSSLNSSSSHSSSFVVVYTDALNICYEDQKSFMFYSYEYSPITLRIRNYHHDYIGVFEEVARKYSISELDIYSKLQIAPCKFKVLDVLSSQLEVLRVEGDITPQWCSSLSQWISNAHCPKMTSLKLQNIGGVGSQYNSDMTRAIYNGFDEVLSACKGKQDSLITFAASSGDIFEYNRSRRLSELDEYNISRKRLVVESLANIIKEYCIVGKEQDVNVEEFDQAVEQMIEHNIFKLTWNLKNSPKIHAELIEELICTGAYNAIDIRKKVKTYLSEICTAIFNKYILPNVTGIDIELFKKLALELQERIVGFTTSKVFNSSSNTKEAQEIKTSQSTVHEDLLARLQEWTTENRAEAAYDIVDNNNNIPGDLTASYTQNFTFQYSDNFL